LFNKLVDTNLVLIKTDDNPDILRNKLQRLPASLEESVEALAKDTALEALLGEKLMVAIKGVRKVSAKLDV